MKDLHLMQDIDNELILTPSEAEEYEDEREIEIADFRMVTFSLGGRDYGIDILKIKEIAKFSNYTYVPNCPSFVKGVYNLRGEIISVIDLRILFNLPYEKSNGVENGLIIYLPDSIVGVVVDKIDKVVAIPSRIIQPPHPLFGDINVKFISGVVEHEGRLYIILDIEKVLGKEESAEELDTEAISDAYASAMQATKTGISTPSYDKEEESHAEPSDSDFDFIAEGLASLASFYVSPINVSWIEKRIQEWKKEKGDDVKKLQLVKAEDAEEFLKGFMSAFTGKFWEKGYMDRIVNLLPTEIESTAFKVWDVGCGKGYEAYSLAAALRQKYQGKLIKIWAQDVDLLSVSMAPNLSVQAEELPAWLGNSVVEGKNGFAFKQEIRDSIVFEYHDVRNTNPFNSIDLIVARDVLSLLPVSIQEEVLEDFFDKLKPKGMLLVGDNESLDSYSGWKRVASSIPLYIKQTTVVEEE
ncbi:CheR family methyltransferase [Spirochaetia bacterium 38H-sp]|uniref:CheR family methyltransferase n=1 Tax=Rarispira pelagica TaxID=3141764 RepID=A0ABU9UCN4_9SPIR